jgi:hypothetical protein
MVNKEENLKDLYTKSKKNKEILDPIFNQFHGCFGCLFISSMTLEEACKKIDIDLEQLIQKLS